MVSAFGFGEPTAFSSLSGSAQPGPKQRRRSSEAPQAAQPGPKQNGVLGGLGEDGKCSAPLKPSSAPGAQAAVAAKSGAGERRPRVQFGEGLAVASAEYCGGISPRRRAWQPS